MSIFGFHKNVNILGGIYDWRMWEHRYPPPFSHIFSDEWHARLVLGPFNQYQVTQIDQISPFVKHVLARQDDFGMQKKLVKQTKTSGFGSDPPLVWEKFPRNIVFFSEENF